MELCFWPTYSLLSKLSSTLFLNVQILTRIFNRKCTFMCNWCRIPWWQARCSSLLVEIIIPGILEVANEFVTAIIFHLLQHNKGWSNSWLWTTWKIANNKLYSSPINNKLLLNTQIFLRNVLAIEMQFHSIYQCLPFNQRTSAHRPGFYKMTIFFWLFLQ